MRKTYILLAGIITVALLMTSAFALAAADPDDLAKGGKLYDKWWKMVPDATEPTNDHPLWATQSTNTRSGADTWRCKECHGWDYMGKDGAYASGSHSTGFTGVYDAGTTMTAAELADILKGSANADHDFSSVIDDDSIDALAAFLTEGLFDMTAYIDSSTKAPVSADADNGKTLYDGTCAACHGTDGRTINFKTDESPEYIGTLANDNPWEFTHKVKFGQPSSAMPAGVVSGWTTQQMIDVLAHSQTLPVGKDVEEAEETPVTATPTVEPEVVAPPSTGTGGLDAGSDLSGTWQALGLLLVVSALGAGAWALRRTRA
jgi:thiosulfate dehydrogenase